MSECDCMESGKHMLERMYKYAQIQYLAYPEYVIKLAGTSSYIYRNALSCYPIGELFLYWDNKTVYIKGSDELFKNMADKLTENDYVVKFE